MNCARGAPPDKWLFLIRKMRSQLPKCQIFPAAWARERATRARYAGRATRAGVLRTAERPIPVVRSNLLYETQ